MALAVKHHHQSVIADDPTKEVSSGEWNEDHDITGSPPGVVPLGGIIMWSGTIAAVPADWHLCDGAAGTPDLRDKFVAGARPDDAGVAKSTRTGALAQTGGTTAHIHSAHGNLSHAGLTVGDHTGLTHALAIANHPDLTHVAIGDHSVASQIVTVQGQTIADHSQASQTVAVPGQTIADHSVPSATLSTPGQTIADHSVPSATLTVPTASLSGVSSAFAHAAYVTLLQSISAQGTARTIVTGSTAQAAHSYTPAGSLPTTVGSLAAFTLAHASQPTAVGSLAAATLAHASQPSGVGSFPANTLAHASQPSGTGAFPAVTLTHPAVVPHYGTVYGWHSITQPADHGAAGTVTHAYNQPNDHVISAHDTVANVIPFYALAFIQRVA